MATEKNENTENNAHAMTVAAFCEAYHISRGTWHNMVVAGKAPAHLNTGGRVIIPRVCVDQWIRDNAKIQHKQVAA